MNNDSFPIALSGDVDASRLALLPVSSPLHIAHRIARVPNVEVRMTKSAGRGLFATADMPPNTCIVSETAVAWQALGTRGGAVTSTLAPADLELLLLQLAPLCWAPADAFTGASVARDELIQDAFQCSSYGVGLAGCEDGAAVARALFPTIAMCNSRCDASAAVEQVATKSAGAAPVYTLTTRRPVAAGDEITVAYVPRSWHRAKRLAALSAGWGIACACPRCARDVDDTAVLRCSACESGRVFFPVSGSSSACVDCGAACVCSPAAAPTALIDSLLPPDPGSDAPLDALDAHADVLLHHSLLALDDTRVFSALSRLLPRVGSAMGDGGQGDALFARLVQAMSAAAARSPFTGLADLGWLDDHDAEEEDGDSEAA